MPVYLQVRQVRDAIFQLVQQTSTAASSTQASNRTFGTLFHDAVADLFSSDPELHCRVALELAESSRQSWQSTLRDILYRTAIGPYLTRNQAALQSSSAEIIGLWQAIENVSFWLAGILWRAHLEFGWPASEFPSISAEDGLTWTLQEPGWSDLVQLGGIADLVLRVPRGKADEPAREDWCIIEFKLGRTSPEADLAQACLYHEMLLQPPRSSSHGALVLVSFNPSVHEQFYETAQLSDARKKLKGLIGSLAGVSGVPRSAFHSVPKAQTIPPASTELVAMQQLLLKTFREFGAPADPSGEPVAGPAFFRFYFVPTRGIKARKMTSLADEIQICLKLQTSPILSLVHGQIVVDVERPDRRFVPFSSIQSQLPAASYLGSSILPVGVDLTDRLVVADLAESKNVHILVVGTTGSGKSEWLRTAIAGLILGNTPETLQFVLIDPKRNAFVDMAGSPYLREQIIYPQESPVPAVLERLVDEMEDRYRQLQATGADNFQDLTAAGIHLPRIVCVCDEYADLIAPSKQIRSDIENQISRLGAKARAAGIHLIIATQEASRETVRRSLDANLPARVGLRTAKDIESRILLGENGTERLLGSGDLLFKDIGAPVRLQAPFLSAAERAEIFQSHSIPKVRQVHQ